jgi:DNA-binding HxlR family transcriptional regulator
MRLCSNVCGRFQAAVDILGRRWTHLILHALTAGPRRFGELSAQLEVVSERMLSERLKELAAEGIVERRVIPETPVQVEYRLTRKGLGLKKVLAAVGEWADEWMEAPEEARPPRPQAASKARKRAASRT